MSLVAMQLKADGFEHYRCDRDMSIGMNMASLSKILKCANNDDVITIKAEDVSVPPFARATLPLEFTFPPKVSNGPATPLLRLSLLGLTLPPMLCRTPRLSPSCSSPPTKRRSPTSR